MSEQDAGGRWSRERAWAWYERLPWLVGCNFLASSAVNFLAMWYGPTFEAETIDRELGWAAGAGFNTVRTNLSFTVWQADRDGLVARMDRFLDIAGGKGIGTVFCLFDDCGFGGSEPVIGPQPRPVPGLHNSRAVASPGRAVVMDKSRWGELEAYVGDIVSQFGADGRILFWDLYNEPGNRDVLVPGGKRRTDAALETFALELMRETFRLGTGGRAFATPDRRCLAPAGRQSALAVARLSPPLRCRGARPVRHRELSCLLPAPGDAGGDRRSRPPRPTAAAHRMDGTAARQPHRRYTAAAGR